MSQWDMSNTKLTDTWMEQDQNITAWSRMTVTVRPRQNSPRWLQLQAASFRYSSSRVNNRHVSRAVRWRVEERREGLIYSLTCCRNYSHHFWKLQPGVRRPTDTPATCGNPQETKGPTTVVVWQTEKCCFFLNLLHEGNFDRRKQI